MNMIHNIKENDLDWIVNHVEGDTFHVGDKFVTEVKNTRYMRRIIYTIKSINHNKVWVSWDDNNREVEIDYEYENVVELFNKGTWIKWYDDNINESDDFDWIDDVEATDRPFVGMRFIHRSDISNSRPDGLIYTVTDVDEIKDKFTVEWFEYNEYISYDERIDVYQGWLHKDMLIHIDDEII